MARLPVISLIFGVLILWLVIFTRMTLAQVPPGYNPCWTQDECNKAGGLWGKDKGKGQEIDNGESITRKCQPMSTGEDTAVCWNTPPTIPLEVGIPGIKDKVCAIKPNISCTDDSQCPTGAGKCMPAVKGGFAGYMSLFYKFFIYALAVMAATMVTWGGFKRIMAAGSMEKIKDANDTIYKAIIGLVLALISYSLLSLINPKLVELTGARLEKIKAQTWGDWCDKELKSSDGKFVMCGEPYKDPSTGATCRGQRCEEVGKGCFPDPDDKLSDGTFKYGCTTNYDACMRVTASNIEKLSGEPDETIKTPIATVKVFNNACNEYSDSLGTCYWFTGVENPTNIKDNDGGCGYITKEAINTYCQDKTRKGYCEDYFNQIEINGDGQVARYEQQALWLACHRDWCDKGCHLGYNVSGGMTWWKCVGN